MLTMNPHFILLNRIWIIKEKFGGKILAEGDDEDRSQGDVQLHVVGQVPCPAHTLKGEGCKIGGYGRTDTFLVLEQEIIQIDEVSPATHSATLKFR